MGRAFEYRMARQMKRWGNLARVFTTFGQDITIDVQAGVGDPDIDPRLRAFVAAGQQAVTP